jgi:nitrogen fixation NifU-like protein
MSARDKPQAPETKDAEREDAEREDAESELARALKHYSEKVVRTWVTRRNYGSPSRVDGRGRAVSDCQDTIEIQLQVEDGRVQDGRFISEGCGATFACGSAAAELARGRTIPGLLSVTPQDVLEELDGLPAHNEHCADLAVTALRRAAQDLIETKQDPWKRLYR